MAFYAHTACLSMIVVCILLLSLLTSPTVIAQNVKVRGNAHLVRLFVDKQDHYILNTMKSKGRMLGIQQFTEDARAHTTNDRKGVVTLDRSVGSITSRSYSQTLRKRKYNVYRSGKGWESVSKQGKKKRDKEGGKSGMAKSVMGKGGKGMGKGKNGMGKGKHGKKSEKKSTKNDGKGVGKGKSGKGIPKICEKLDFSADYGDESRKLATVFNERNRRNLQFKGELCHPNVLYQIRNNPDTSVFAEAIEAAGLEEIFDCAGPFTALVPTNAAIGKNPALLSYLMENPRKLQEVLLYHIVPGFYRSTSFDAGTLASLAGVEINVRLDPLTFNRASVVYADNLGCNGVIHTIDDLMIPPNSGILPEICNMLDFRRSGEFPNDNRSADVTSAEHLFRRRQLQFEGVLCTPNMYSVIRNNPNTQNFAALLDASHLTDLFLCAGPFTILAPSNESIEALDRDLIEELLLPENRKRLQELLLYHIIPQYLPLSGLTEGPINTILGGKDVIVSQDPPSFNNVGIVYANNMGCNGVLHVLNDVLVPDDDFCSIYEFDKRRRLQNGGAGCQTNTLDTARENPNLMNAIALIDASGLAPIFECAGPFTMLLPSNEAIASIDKNVLKELLLPENKDQLQEFILYHILPEATLSTDFVAGQKETLLEGATVDVNLNPLTFNTATVVTADILACNGYINIINTILTEVPTSDQPSVGPDTPSPSPATDLPTALDVCSMYTFSDSNPNCDPNILAFAQEDPDLSTLVSLLEIAGFENILNCPGAFTGFFPSNDAFDALDPNILSFLVDPKNLDALKGLLQYHLLAGSFPSAVLANTPGRIETLLEGEDVMISADAGSNGGFMVNDATITVPDLQGCNGIIHVIDTVILPLQTEAPSVTPPLVQPTAAPVPGQTFSPTAAPIAGTTTFPSAAPIPGATTSPTVVPVAGATSTPTAAPVPGATSSPTVAPAPGITSIPTIAPVRVATSTPRVAPAPGITSTPTMSITVPPTAAIITAIPTGVNGTVIVRVRNFYIAFSSPGANEPTQAEYDAAVVATQDFYNEAMKAYFANQPNRKFVSMDISLDSTAFETPGLPTQGEIYNIYMDFDFSNIEFEIGSDIPSPEEVFEALRNSLDASYLENYIIPIGGPFGLVNGLYFDAVDTAGTTVPAPTP